MNTINEGQNTPTVLYVDPNREFIFSEDKDKDNNRIITNRVGRDLLVPPENLCIAVQLQVSIPDRNTVTIEWKNTNGKQNISFFEGKYIGGQHILTDFYQDISFRSESTSGGGENEAMGIRSINIEYNSWYLPQVSIEFVDVRGMSLMNPIQAFKDKNIENAINSFFSAFYTIPYPLFKLLVKGVYGDSVTYDLVAQDIRTTLDPLTGNVIISASFVGFSFAMFADVPFDWIKSAPYNKYGQGETLIYWTEQIKNKRFTFDSPDDNVPIPTFPQLYDIIQKTIRIVEKNDQEGPAAKRKMKLDDINSKLEIIEHKFNEFLRAVIEYINPSQGNPSKPVISFDDIDNGILLFFTINELNLILDNETLKSYDDEIESFIKAYNEIIDNGEIGVKKIQSPIKTIMDNTFVKKINSSHLQNDYGLKPETDYFMYEIDYLFFKENIKDIKNEINNGIEQSKRDLLNDTYKLIKENFNFTPTIGNMVKLFFAHFEMFFYSFFEVIKNIRIENGVGRRCEDYGDSKQITDLIDTENDGKETAMLPPWFGIRTPEGEGSIKCWPGSPKVREILRGNKKNWQDLEEVKFLNSYNDSIIDYKKEIDDIVVEPNSETETSESNIWLPINPFDISNTILETGIHSTNPYKQIIVDSDSKRYLNEIIAEVGIRLFYGVSTWGGINNSGNTILAKAEAKNVFDVIKDQQDLLLRIENTLNTESILSVWNEYKILNIDKNGVGTYSMLEHQGGFVIPFASIGKRQYKSGCRQIIDDNNNFKVNNSIPLFFSHSNLKKSSWNNEYKTIFNIQPYSDKINSFINTIQSIDNGSELIQHWDIDRNNFRQFFYGHLEVVSDKKGYNQKDLKIYVKDPTNPTFDIFYTNLNENKDKTKLIGNLNANRNQKPMLLEVNLVDGESLFVFPTYTTYLDNFINDSGNSTQKYVLPYFQMLTKDTQRNLSYNIFTDPDYYDLNKSNRYATSEDRDYHKVQTFLWSLGISPNIVYQYLDENFRFSCIKRLPKIILLYIGGEIWLYKNIEKFESFKKENKGYYNKKVAELKTDIQDVLVNYFKAWAKSDGINIIKQLELRNKKENDRLFSSGKEFTNACERIINKAKGRIPQNPLTEHLFDEFGDDICNTYCGAHFITKGSLLNKDYFLNLLLDPSSPVAISIKEIMTEDVIVSSNYYQIFYNSEPRNIIVNGIDGYIETFLTRLKELIKENKETNNLETNKSTEIIKNIDLINFGKYEQFKKIYDRWLSWDDSNFNNWKLERFYNNSKKDTTNLPAINIIDKFYCNISHLLMCNLDIIDGIIKDINNEESSFLTIISNLFAKHKMLFVPTPNRLGISNIEGLKDVFKPYTYSQMSSMSVQPGYTAIYIGEPSSQPSIGQYGKGSKYKNDTLNIGGSLAVTQHNIPSPPPSYGNVSDVNIPVFSVSYGKQNQSYFKLANISNTNPIVTDQTTRATVDLAKMGNPDGTEVKYGGQDLYDVYSANAYTVEVEMLGCAKIMPLMYFQLNNVYLFSGAYMIFKMSHNITPGKMVTRFTGIKQTNYRTDLTDNPFFAQTLIDDSVDTEVNIKPVEIINNSNEVSDGIPPPNQIPSKPVNRNNSFHWYGPAKWVSQISDENTINYAVLKDTKVSKYYKLSKCVEASNRNKALTNGSWDRAGEDMPVRVYENLVNFMPNIDIIKDYIENNMFNENNAKIKALKNEKGNQPYQSNLFSIDLESIWRRYDPKKTSWYQTFHGFGTAADIHVTYNKVRISSIAHRKLIYGLVYDFILKRFKGQISELFFETKEACGGNLWIHYAWTPSTSKNSTSKNFNAC
jgi:hypothetical protein